MSTDDKPKPPPFATWLFDSTLQRYTARVGDNTFGEFEMPHEAQAFVEMLNEHYFAAVEAREVKLRGVLERFVRYSTPNDYDGKPMCAFCERKIPADPIFHADHLNSCGGATLAEEARAALGPNPPAYVPAAQLEAAEANGLRAPTLDEKAVSVRAINIALRAVSSRYLIAVKDGRLFIIDTANGEERPTHYRTTTGADVQFTHPLHQVRERILVQHLQACDDLVRDLADRLPYTAAGVFADMQRVVEHPGNGVLQRDIFTLGRTQWVVETTLQDGNRSARTTTTQREAPLTP